MWTKKRTKMIRRMGKMSIVRMVNDEHELGAGRIWHRFEESCLPFSDNLKILNVKDSASGLKFSAQTTESARAYFKKLGSKCQFPSSALFFSRSSLARPCKR